MRIHIVKGNKKIDRSGAIFDLPIGTTCIDTADCRKWCYRIKNEWTGNGYPPVRNQCENLQATYSSSFVSDAVTGIRANKIKLFRFHDAGPPRPPIIPPEQPTLPQPNTEAKIGER